MSFKKALKFLKLRLKEPTTYAGLAVVAASFGFQQEADTLTKVGAGVAMVLGGGLVAVSEHPKDSDRP